MHFIIKDLLLIRRLYTRQTTASILINLVFGLLVLFILFSVLLKDWWTIFCAVGVIGGYLLIRTTVKSIIIQRRRVGTASKVLLQPGLPMMLQLTAIYDAEHPNHTKSIAAADDWRLYESEVDIYRHTKYGDYLSKQIYYTVFEGKLSRQLPNILFDSERAKGHQFKYKYIGSQRLSLEGDFDDTFTVYAPDHYEIDTLSFITPEVMEALKAAHDYDIEIVSDRLFLYGPLLLEDKDVNSMQEHGLKIVAAINDNVDTYTDSYLSGEARRTTTTPFARELLLSPLKPIVLTVVLALVSISIIADAIIQNNSDIIFNEASFFVFVFFVTFATSSYKIVMHNRRANQQFTQDQKFLAYTRPRSS